MRWMVFAALLALGCSGDDDSKDIAPDAGNPDGDADTDADSDADSDADTDTDIEPEPDADNDGSPDDADCDDTDPDVYPGAPDTCGDDLVTDCDRDSDDGLVTVDGGSSFTDLQQALDVAAAGSEVRVCPGSYIGTFVAPVGVDLVSHGGDLVTLLDGDAAGTTLTVPGDSEITGFTVTGGLSNTRSGGILMSSTGTLTVTDCIVSSNSGKIGGGIEVAPGADVVIAGTSIFQNDATDAGGGLYVTPGATVDLTGSTVEDNGATPGAGVFIDGGTLIGGLVTGNDAPYTSPYVVPDVLAGGGIAATGSAAVTGTDVTGNTARYGGGVSGCSGHLVLTDVSIHDNDATDGAGGGLLVYLGEVEMVGTSEVVGNRGPFGAGAYLFIGTLTGGRLAENDAIFVGGGVAAEVGTLDGVAIESNQSFDGGGIWAYDDLTVLGGTISGNEATNTGGAIVTIVGAGGPGDRAIVLDGVAIVDNTAPLGGALNLDTGTTTITGGTVLRNSAGEGGGANVAGAALLSSVSTDWGTDADDNLPTDVHAGIDFGGYGPAATFDCDSAGCAPIP